MMQKWRDKLDSIAQTYANLQGELAAGELSVPALVEKNKALATLEPLARVINQYRQLDQEQAQALVLAREADPELRPTRRTGGRHSFQPARTIGGDD